MNRVTKIPVTIHRMLISSRPDTSHIVLWLLAAWFGMGANAIAAPPTAAILGWSVDDDHYASHREAEQLAGWLEAELLSQTDYEWVDRVDLDATRDELSLASAGGIADPATWLRVGLWVKADVLVVGRVQRVGDDWDLLGQVIDVERADLLASWDTRVAGEDGEPLDLASLDPAAWLAEAREAVVQSQGVYAESREQIAVAALYFENTTDVGRRLDHLEYRVDRALAQSFNDDEKVRLLRFPGVQRATAEHELVLSGLAAGGGKAVRRMADVYLWGTYREVDWQGVPFREVPIEFTLNLWTGRGRPVEKVFRGRAGDLPALVEEVTAAARSWSRKQKSGQRGTHSAAAARNISQSLHERATRLQAINRGNEWDVTPAFRHRWKRTVRLLEIAYFFDAKNADLHRELLAERYRDDLAYLNRTVHGEPWRQAALDAEIQHHIDRFGFDTSWPTMFRRPQGGSIADNRFPHGGRMSISSLTSLRGPLGRGLGLRDTPREVRQQDIERYNQLAIRRAHAALNADPQLDTLNAVLGMDLGGSADLKAQMIERAWPQMNRQVLRPRHEWQVGLIQKAFAKAGREEQAQTYVAQLEIIEPPAPRGSDPDTLPADTGPFSDNMDFLPRLTQLAAPPDGWPPLLDAAVEPVVLPRFDFHDFPHIWRHGDTLWVNLLLENHRRNTRELNTWRYTPADQEWHGTTGWVRTNRRVTQAITSPAFDPDAVWLATEGHSVGRLNAITGESRVIGPTSGLTSTRFRDASATKDRLVFGGGERGEPGQLNFYIPAINDWVAVAIPAEEYGGTLIQHLAATDDAVLIAGTDWGSSPILLRYDFATEDWTPMRQRWLDHIRSAPDTQELRPQPRTDRLNPEVLHRDPDGQTIWLGSPFGLTRYRTADDAMHTWFARPPVHPDDPPLQGEAPVRLFGMITAIHALPDGQHLAVATESRQSRRGLGGTTIGTYLFVFDKHAEEWVGHFPLPLSGYTRVSQLLADDTQLWLTTTRGEAKLMAVDLDELVLRAE